MGLFWDKRDFVLAYLGSRCVFCNDVIMVQSDLSLEYREGACCVSCAASEDDTGGLLVGKKR